MLQDFPYRALGELLLVRGYAEAKQLIDEAAKTNKESEVEHPMAGRVFEVMGEMAQAQIDAALARPDDGRGLADG